MSAPSPYRFTVSVERSQGNLLTWWHVLVKLTTRDVITDWVFMSEAEARSHAALVLAALHQAVIE